jgi:hypothetical protein
MTSNQPGTTPEPKKNILDVHPAPWRWDDRYMGIVDARGTGVVSGGSVGYENADLCVDKDVLPLILAVPEMLAILRVLVRSSGGESWARAVQDGAALVERLDACQAQ